MPFVKLDCGILKSSLWAESPAVRLTFLTALALCDADGICRTTPPGLAVQANLPVRDVRKALRTLESPDPDDRSGVDNGKRMIRVQGGYRIVNYLHYRHRDESATMRMQNKRERDKLGITAEIAEQDGHCGCCGETFGTPYALYVVRDHCHTSLLNRSLVCQSCNRIIGQIENGQTCTSIKRSVVEAYIERWKSVTDAVTPRNVTQGEGEGEADPKRQNKGKRERGGGGNGSVPPPSPPSPVVDVSLWEVFEAVGRGHPKQLAQEVRACEAAGISHQRIADFIRAHPGLDVYEIGKGLIPPVPRAPKAPTCTEDPLVTLDRQIREREAREATENGGASDAR